jgi:hypothetical protein
MTGGSSLSWTKMIKDYKNFGLIVGSLVAIFGANNVIFLFLSLFLLLPALIYPKILELPYKLWMKLADILGFIMTRVILIILFYLILTPTTIILKIINKDLLNLEFEPNKPSYWINKDKLDKTSLLKQY